MNAPVGAAVSVEELAARQAEVTNQWKNEPAGLSAMGFARATRGPLPDNPELRALQDEKTKAG